MARTHVDSGRYPGGVSGAAELANPPAPLTIQRSEARRLRLPWDFDMRGNRRRGAGYRRGPASIRS